MERLFAKRGLGYVMSLPEIATELTVNHLHRTRGETHGELVVVCGLPGTRSSDGHLHQATFNLSGSEARNRLAKTLGTLRKDLVDVVGSVLTARGKPHGAAAAETLVSSFDGVLIGALPRPASQRRAFVRRSIEALMAGLG